MRRRHHLVAALATALLLASPAVLPSAALPSAGAPPAPAAPDPGPVAQATPLQVFGTWHCGDDYCTWSTVRDMADFDAKNHWIVDRGDGRPSVNLVVLSFVNPLDLLQGTDDAAHVDGVPVGMNQAVVDYFTSRGIRVQLSIGGITYTDDWNAALAADPAGLGLAAAAAATRLGVGIEIDYEENTGPDLAGLQAFIDAYRSVHPYDATGADPRARLTIDLAAGDRYLQGITRKATADWLRTDLPVLDYANAMVPARQPSPSTAIANWQEHIDGKAQYAPPIPPLAPAKFTGSLYLTGRNAVEADCNSFASSVMKATSPWVTTAAPNGAGTTPGLLGYMFWAAERPSVRGSSTVPPTSCEGGMGVGATTFGIPLPMPALRQS
ncbi:hypothetical protein [Antribacter gilvus]|uniref:hypothetical protein n=1 Tax=Antribacter gilvus TaxID=2304675 RepID=UPI0019813C89|nr:hypothetical protein [Antribacter gilvus]